LGALRALHQVRDRLLRTDARRFTVEAIAYECGFRRMGRFSSYYRELFDEFPSETLARVGESVTRTSSVAQPLLASHGTVA
jgi:transcriptional regulator GlxA family with amidase domain